MGTALSERESQTQKGGKEGREQLWGRRISWLYGVQGRELPTPVMCSPCLSDFMLILNDRFGNAPRCSTSAVLPGAE